MNNLTDIARTIIATAGRPDVQTAMQEFYDVLDRQIADQPHTCWNKGACCRFGSYGHRLYVTTLEAAYYFAGGRALPARPDLLDEDACLHAIDGRCCARQVRPTGCRVFFCDSGAQHWQGPLTEEKLQQLRDMHIILDVPYLYVDWIKVLRSIRRAIPGAPPPQSQGR